MCTKENKYTLSNIMLSAIIISCMYAIQRVNFTGIQEMSIFEMFILVSGIFILSLFYFVFEKKNSIIKLNIPLFVALVVIFIGNVITVALAPQNYDVIVSNAQGNVYNLTAEIDIANKIVGILSSLMFFYSIYLFVDIVPRKIHTSKQLKLIFYGLLLFALIAFVFSLICNIDSYSNLFARDSSARTGITSFTNNPNNYAGILFLGILASLFLHHLTKRFYYYFFVLVFFIAMVFTLSRTYVISAFILIFGYLIMRAIFEFKKHKIKVIVSTLTISLVVASFLISYFICKSNDCIDSFPPFVIMDLFFDRLTQGLSGREFVWSQSIAVINSTNSWGFGVGFSLFGTILYKLQTSSLAIYSTATPDNGLIQIIADGGIALAILILFIFSFLVYASIKIYKNNKKLFYFTLIILLSFVFQMFFEAGAPLTASYPLYNCCFMTIFLYVPILSIYYHEKNPTLSKVKIIGLADNKNDSKMTLLSKICAFILTLCFIIFVGILSPYFKGNEIIGVFCIVFTIAFVSLPLVLELFQFRNFSFKKWFLTTLLPYVLSAAILISICHALMYYQYSIDIIFIELIIMVPCIYVSLFFVFKHLRKNTGYFMKVYDFISTLFYKLLIYDKDQVILDQNSQTTDEQMLEITHDEFNKLYLRLAEAKIVDSKNYDLLLEQANNMIKDECGDNDKSENDDEYYNRMISELGMFNEKLLNK